jgi:hypothetical protein
MALPRKDVSEKIPPRKQVVYTMDGLIVSTFFISYQNKENHFSYEGINDIWPHIEQWYNSILKHNLKAIVLVDQEAYEMAKHFEHENIHFELVDPKGKLNAIDIRWQLYCDLIKTMQNTDKIFFTDITDVVVLQNPFPQMEMGKIYVGDEEHYNFVPIDLTWDYMFHRWNLLKENKSVAEFAESAAAGKRVYNAGLLGGYVKDIMPIIWLIHRLLRKFDIKECSVDMCALNYVLYCHFYGQVVHGKPVNTIFWEQDINNKECWFKHK